MDVPSNDAEVVAEKIEDEKDGGLTFHCNLSDTEIAHKIAQEFLPGLASACVDNTTGGMFRTPGSVAVNIRTEMVEYLTKRSETFVAESVTQEDPDQPEVSDHPFDIISDFIEDFALSKRNFFSRVSGWMLSEKREDKIDDFVQDMEITGFWLMDRREAIAQVLLKNVDFKNGYHCDKKFNSEEELNEHMLQCGFNSMICPNEGCNARFSATHLEKHDSICPFKIIPCEQKCPATLMRRDMDRHCITVCGMKLANCPFYAVGCQTTVPQCMMQQHHQDDLSSHLLFILQKLHRDKSLKVLKKRIEQLEKSYFDKLVKASDVRSLTFASKDLEAELGPFEEDTVNEYSEEGKVNEEVKLDEEGKANKEVNITEEGKFDESGKINENEKVSNEGESNGGGKSNEQGKVSEGGAIKEGTSNKQEEVREEGKDNVYEEEIICDEGNFNKEGKIDGGKVNEDGKIDDGEKRVNEEAKANEAGKVSGGGVKEGEVHEEGENNEREVNEEGIIHDEGNVNKEEKVNEEGKFTDDERVNEDRRANEAGKVNKEEKAREESHSNEAGEVNKEVRFSGGETNGVKVSEEGKINVEVRVNEDWTKGKDIKEENVNDRELISEGPNNGGKVVEEDSERSSFQTRVPDKAETHV